MNKTARTFIHGFGPNAANKAQVAAPLQEHQEQQQQQQWVPIQQYSSSSGLAWSGGGPMQQQHVRTRSSPVKMLAEEHEHAVQLPQKKSPSDFADFSQTKLDVHQVSFSLGIHLRLGHTHIPRDNALDVIYACQLNQLII